MGTREFITEHERQTRRDRVEEIGLLAFGGSWQTPLAAALKLPRARVAQWMLVPDETKDKNVPAKPVPRWVMDALPAIARDAAVRLRVAADKLDALAAEDGAPPAPHSEPGSDGETPQESGPAAAEAEAEASAPEQGFSIDVGSLARADDDFDIDGFVERYAHVTLPRPDPEPEPAAVPPEGWRSRFAEEHNASWRGVFTR